MGGCSNYSLSFRTEGYVNRIKIYLESLPTYIYNYICRVWCLHISMSPYTTCVCVHLLPTYTRQVGAGPNRQCQNNEPRDPPGPRLPECPTIKVCTGRRLFVLCWHGRVDSLEVFTIVILGGPQSEQVCHLELHSHSAALLVHVLCCSGLWRHWE